VRNAAFQRLERVLNDGDPERNTLVAKSLACNHQFQEEMMRKAHRLTGLRTTIVALGLFVWTASDSRADALFNYSTAGSIDTSTGISGPTAISYIPVSNGSFTSPSSFSLGNFQTLGLQAGQTTTYTNTPFSITFQANTVDGLTPVPNGTPITITGELNGTVNGPNQSSVKATFDPITVPTFLTGLYTNTIGTPNNPLSLVPSTTNSGQTSAQADLSSVLTSPAPVPEPTSIALFLTTLGGLGLRHRLRSRRAA
jgi:hypothetical protein